MKTITDIIPQVRDKKRVNIYLDGAYFCGMELITVMQNKLKIGTVIDEKSLGKMQFESERTTAMDKALTYISGSQKTEKQVKDKLKQKGYTDEVITEVIKKLKEYGYVDDVEYAKAYVSSYQKNKGKRLLEKELYSKGIKGSDIEIALSTVTDEMDGAKQIAEKYLRNKEINYQTVQKCYKYLLSKGYDYDTAKTALEGLDFNEDN